MKSTERTEARLLRHKGFSIKEIEKKVDASRGSISYWVRDVQLTKKQKERLSKNQGSGRALGSISLSKKYETIRRAHQKEGRSLAKRARADYIAGAMLFWAEGHKRRNSVMITNSDPDLLGFFLSFLRRYFGIKDTEIKFRVHWHQSNGAYSKILNFWSKKLCIPKTCFKKDWVDTRERKGDMKVGKHPRGIGCLAVHRTDIAQKLYGSIQEIIGIEKPEWLLLRRG